jgi:hypothetical protein
MTCAALCPALSSLDGRGHLRPPCRQSVLAGSVHPRRLCDGRAGRWRRPRRGVRAARCRHLRPGLEGPAGGRCLPAVHGPNWQPAGTVAPSPGVPHRRLCGSGRADRQGARRPRAGAFRRPGAPAGWPRSGHLRVRHSCTAASRTRQRRGRYEPEFATVTKDSSDATRPSCGNSPRCCQRRSKVDPLAPEN